MRTRARKGPAEPANHCVEIERERKKERDKRGGKEEGEMRKRKSRN